MPNPTTMRNSPSGQATLIVRDVVFDAAAVANATAPDQAVTVPGAEVGDTVEVTPLGVWPAGLTAPQARVSAPDTVQLRIANVTAAPIDPASQPYRFVLKKLVP